MPIQYVDPSSEPSVAVDPYDLVATLADQPTLGLFANSFLGSVEFLDELAPALAALLPHGDFLRFDKGGTAAAATPLHPDQAKAMSTACDALVVAYGH